MIGKLKIMELRDRAQKTLGDKFNYGAFHDAVLKSGPVPLTVLEVADRFVDRSWRITPAHRGGSRSVTIYPYFARFCIVSNPSN